MEPFIGTIMAFGFNFAPRGWAKCEGQLLPINQHTALFSLLGTTYGGDGRTTFALPDLRGRVMIGEGNGPGLSDHRMGAKSGSETNTLIVQNLPSHNHSFTGHLNANEKAGDSDDPQNAALAVTESDNYNSNNVTVRMKEGSVTGEIGHTGNNQPVNNMQPYLALNYCIALQGIFPSRS